MVPPLLMIAIDRDEEFPLLKTNVPPAKTGLAVTPKLLNETVEPVVTVVVEVNAIVIMTVVVAAA